MHRSRRALGGLLAALLAVTACSSGSDRDPLAADPAFYEPPEPLPAGAPGDILRAEELPGAEGSGPVWRVLYRSASVGGEPIAVSAIVAVPPGSPPEGGWPVLSLAHGTVGMADECAPSRQPGRSASDAARRGFVVVATDYEGLGTPGPHPYLVGESAGRTVIDAVRAARALDVGAGDRYAVLGFSQGGHAALFANQIAATWAPELQLLGTVAGAPVVELDAWMDHLLAIDQAALVAMLLTGFAAVDPAVDPASVLSPTAQAVLPVLEEACSAGILAAFDGTGEGRVATDPRTVPEIARNLVANTPGTASAGPVLVLQGTEDELLPAALTDAAVARLCALGQPVERRDYPGVDHVGIIEAAFLDAVAWVVERFEGQPPSSTC